MSRRLSGWLVGALFAVGGCAGSQTDRHAEPYALLIPSGETAPDPLPENTVVLPAEPAPDEPSSEPIAQRLVRARRLYRDLAFEASLGELRRAESLLEAQLQSSFTYPLLDRLFLLRGLDELALGRVDVAQRAFRQAALLRPERVELDRAEFSPEVRNEYERARALLVTEASLVLEVESGPPGAELLVDGVLELKTPASVPLSRGRHYLVVRAAGYEAATRVVDVDEETAPTLRIDLEPSSELRLAGDLAALDADAFAALDSALRLRLVPGAGKASPVHFGRSTSGWAASLVERSSGDIRVTRLSSASAFPNAAPELVAELRDAPEKKPLVRQWWLWTVVGVVVVGTSLGLYFGLREQPEPQLVIAQP